MDHGDHGNNNDHDGHGDGTCEMKMIVSIFIFYRLFI